MNSESENRSPQLSQARTSEPLFLPSPNHGACVPLNATVSLQARQTGSLPFSSHPPAKSAFTALLPHDSTAQSSDVRRRESYTRKRHATASRKPAVFSTSHVNEASSVIPYDVVIFPMSVSPIHHEEIRSYSKRAFHSFQMKRVPHLSSPLPKMSLR